MVNEKIDVITTIKFDTCGDRLGISVAEDIDNSDWIEIATDEQPRTAIKVPKYVVPHLVKVLKIHSES